MLSQSIFIAEGTFGSPGIVSISPVYITINPAPDDNLASRTVILKFSGFPRSEGLSESEYCVFAIHTGRCPNPSFSISEIDFSA